MFLMNSRAMETTSRRRVLFPFLALLFTLAAFALVMFCAFLGSSPFVRLVQGTISFYSLPSWFRYCLLHPALIKTLGRLGFYFSILGAMLTLWLLLKTEPLDVAYGRLKGIVGAVLLMTGLFLGIVLGGAIFATIPALVNGGVTRQLTAIFLMFLPAVPPLCAFWFIVITIPFSLAQIAGRSRAFGAAHPTPHVLQ